MIFSMSFYTLHFDSSRLVLRNSTLGLLWYPTALLHGHVAHSHKSSFPSAVRDFQPINCRVRISNDSRWVELTTRDRLMMLSVVTISPTEVWLLQFLVLMKTTKNLLLSFIGLVQNMNRGPQVALYQDQESQAYSLQNQTSDLDRTFNLILEKRVTRVRRFPLLW